MIMARSVRLSAPRDLDRSDAPYLLERDDADFLSATLAELSSDPGLDRLRATRAQARNSDRTLKLFPPVQRRFHLALVEVSCDEPGRPRLDPARVESAGMVVRRLYGHGGAVEGWLRGGGVLQGWAPVDRLGGGDSDPAAEVRRTRSDTGVASLDRALRALEAGSDTSILDEDIVPMFVAPPDVCCRTGRTVYYGVVPTASSDVAETEPDLTTVFEGFEADSSAFRAHLVQPLRGVLYRFPPAPDANDRFDADWLESLMEAAPGTAEHRFLLLLRQVAVEFDAFGDSPESADFLGQLEGIRLRYRLRDDEDERRTVSAADFLANATSVLMDGGSGSVEMPEDWPALNTPEREALSRAMSSAMLKRFESVAGRPGRYDDPDARYVLRTFVRLKPEDGCPSQTIWSEYTEPFVIAPWYESVGDPVQIALPDMADRDLLRKMRPNVAFTLPPALNALLSSNPKDLMEGKSGNAPVELGWICSFSIPVITFCAFLVLNIFLSLFDLIFRWKMFIKICVPYPKARG